MCAAHLLQLSSIGVLGAAGEIRLAKYQEAISLLMRFGAACDRLGLRPCKAYLGAIVVCLYAQDAQQAMATLQVCWTQALLMSASVQEGGGSSNGWHV